MLLQIQRMYAVLSLLLNIPCFTFVMAFMINIAPPADDAQAEALSGLLAELHGERVPQVVFLVLGLVPVDHQADSLRCLPQNIDGLIMSGLAKVNAVDLWPARSRTFDVQQQTYRNNTNAFFFWSFSSLSTLLLKEVLINEFEI